MTCGQVWWPILRICALHLTHSMCTHTQQWTHTHTTWTHTHTHREHTHTHREHTHTHREHTHTHREHTHTHTVNTHTHTHREHTHTQQWTHTHTPWTHTQQWTNTRSTRGQLGVRCLAQGSHLSRGIEGGERVERALVIHYKIKMAW